MFLVLGALLMIALLAFAALAIDIANARQQHRQLRNAADAAALAAGQDLPNMVAAVATVKDYANRNYDIASSEWVGCTDPDRLALIPDAANANQCISFPADRGRVRVKLPEQSVTTYFGSAIGRDTLEFDASATAAAVVGQADRIVPAAVTGPMGTGLLCIEQAGANQPCANRERGQFGSLASPRLNLYKPTSNVEQNSLAINYAMNLDHNIEAYDGSVAVCDGPVRSPCTTTNQGTYLNANHLLSTTGNSVPPVTEGYVTGFSATTVDQGNTTFCGRLQRPDFTESNLLDPRPGNCNTPGQPTISVLGKTINGRHIYYWLNAANRSRFYPEVVALGLADTNQTLALTNSGLFGPGDTRLDCFLAGYRYNTATGVESLPTCSGVSYTSSPDTPWTHSVLDLFSTSTYNRNDGTVNWAGSWTETMDDDQATSGVVQILQTTGPAGYLSLDPKSTGTAITRTADPRNPASGNLANTATLTYRYQACLANQVRIGVEVSTNGSTWTQLEELFAPQNCNSWVNRSLALPSNMISATTRLRFISARGQNNSRLWLDDVKISFGGTTPAPPGQIAPIFRQNFNTDPRWAVIPRIGAFNNPNATPITRFWGFFGYKSYSTSTKVQAFDAWVFDPALMLNNPSSDTFFYGFSPQPVVRLVN